MTIPTMVSIKEASRQTGISYEFIRQLIRERKIIYVRAGVKFLVNMESLQLKGYPIKKTKGEFYVMGLTLKILPDAETQL